MPEEVLAEGSGPQQDADSLAEAAADALGAASSNALDDATLDAKGESKPPRRRSRRSVVTSDEVIVEAVREQETDDETAALMDTEVGPELEEAEVEASRVAHADEQVLEDAVMRAEAEAELGTAESEAEAGEEDLELNAALPTTAATMDDVQLKHLVEALIFAADKPVTLQRLRQLTRISDVKRLDQALAALAQDFAARGIALQQVSGGYQFRTNTHYSTWVQQLIAGRPVRLSRAQLETLAIVAYRQPITRPEVDEIRGVDSSATLRLLMDRSLIRILGKQEAVGRPLLYGTTKEFLDFFSLSELRELPTLREYSELSAESRQVMSDRLGIDADGNVIGGDQSEGLDDGSMIDGMDTTAAPEPSVDDLVREFAQAEAGAEMAAAVVAAAEAAAIATDDVAGAEDMVAAVIAAAEAHGVASTDLDAHVGGDQAATDLDTCGDQVAATDLDTHMGGDRAATALDVDADGDGRMAAASKLDLDTHVGGDQVASKDLDTHVGGDQVASKDLDTHVGDQDGDGSRYPR